MTGQVGHGIVPEIIAHRGASGQELENTLAAFRLAIEQGADGIELDVHFTADGVPVVHHDPVVDGQVIAEGAAAELAGHRLANGEVIPTLAEALAVIGDGVKAYIEAKALPSSGDAALLAVIDASPDPEACQVHSFDHRIVRRLKDARNKLATGVLSASYQVNPSTVVRSARAETLWQSADMIDDELVRAVHRDKLRLIAWTVDDPDRLRQLARMGVDGLCTNFPALAREALNGH